MKNYIQHADTIPLTAPTGGVTGGNFYKVGSFFGCAAHSAAEGLPFELRLKGAMTGPKATGESWAEGDLLYWDNTNSKFTKTSSGNTKQAIALAAAVNGDTTGSVVLKHSI